MDIRQAMDSSYLLGKKHLSENLSNVLYLSDFIKSQGFTCDQLKELILLIDDIKGSDYYEEESTKDAYDRSEAQKGQY